MYGPNLERRIFDKILYEVDSSDIPRFTNAAVCLKQFLGNGMFW
jgi:hypothetical protein